MVDKIDSVFVILEPQIQTFFFGPMPQSNTSIVSTGFSKDKLPQLGRACTVLRPKPLHGVLPLLAVVQDAMDYGLWATAAAP
jgi:hypothetical protein